MRARTPCQRRRGASAMGNLREATARSGLNAPLPRQDFAARLGFLGFVLACVSPYSSLQCVLRLA